MHYLTNYANLSDDEKRVQAIRDIRMYMGDEAFQRISTELVEHNLSFGMFAFYAAFCGVQGYPVRAWYQYCYPNATIQEPGDLH